MARLRTVRGVGDNAFEKLNAAGFDTVEKIAEADVEELAESTELTEQKAKQLRFGANQLPNCPRRYYTKLRPIYRETNPPLYLHLNLARVSNHSPQEKRQEPLQKNMAPQVSSNISKFT